MIATGSLDNISWWQLLDIQQVLSLPFCVTDLPHDGAFCMFNSNYHCSSMSQFQRL